MGQLTILQSSLVYVDTVTIIYSVEKFPNYYPLLEPIWLQLQTDKIQIITSELTLLETLILPIRSNATDLIKRYERLLLASKVSSLPINRTILKQAASLRATSNLKTPDAIHAATALSAGCTHFLTNDAGLRNVPGLSVVILNDILNA